MIVRLNQLTEVPARVKVLFPPFSDQTSKVSLGAIPVEQQSRFIGGLALPIMAVGAKGHLERIKSANAYAVTSGSASFLMTMLD